MSFLARRCERHISRDHNPYDVTRQVLLGSNNLDAVVVDFEGTNRGERHSKVRRVGAAARSRDLAYADVRVWT